MFPYATPKAIAEAQDAAEALADQLNEKAGHSIAAAKVRYPMPIMFQDAQNLQGPAASPSALSQFSPHVHLYVTMHYYVALLPACTLAGIAEITSLWRVLDAKSTDCHRQH